jgi:pimeloyl-ACP methyl ester carboxylesterase
VLREGEGEPLVLLHGVTGSKNMWRRVMPLLAPDFEVFAPTALGHHGGTRRTVVPTVFEHVLDDAERCLDEAGLEKPHLAGNSMGGWLALELARRGRASSVCALSPAGFWDAGWADKQRVLKTLHTAVRDTRRSHRMLPFLGRSRRFRRWAMRNVAANGRAVSLPEFLDAADAQIACELTDDMLETVEQMAALDPVPCPITMAWAQYDRIFPPGLYGNRAQELVPGARSIVIDGVGHVPMFDDPALVARAIRDSIARK